MVLASFAAAVALALLCPTCEISRAAQLPTACDTLQRLEYVGIACCLLLCFVLLCCGKRSPVPPWATLRCLALACGFIHCTAVLLLETCVRGREGDSRRLVYPPGIQFWPALMLGVGWIVAGCCATHSRRGAWSLRLRHATAQCPSRCAHCAVEAPSGRQDELHEVTASLLCDGSFDRRRERPEEKPEAAPAETRHGTGGGGTQHGQLGAFRQWMQACERDAEPLGEPGGPCNNRQRRPSSTGRSCS